MTVFGPGRSASGAHPLHVYIGVLLVILVMIAIAGAATIWSTADNSGTNALSSDRQSMSPPAPLTSPQ